MPCEALYAMRKGLQELGAGVKAALGLRPMSMTSQLNDSLRVPSLVAAGKTDPGRLRPLNEDAWQIAPEENTGHLWTVRGQLFAVADGMGGHAAGEIASQLALDTLIQQYYSSDDTPLPPAIRLERAVLEANLDIYEQAVTVDTQAGMGTTIVTAVIHEDRLTVANVGDSRAYLVRNGEIVQITDDHSWVAEQVKLGTMTDQQAQNHAYRNVVTRCLGHKPGIQVDIFEHRLRVGDTILLCSDGLSNQVSVQELGRTLLDYAPAQAAEKLVDLANQAGGPDNITAVVIQVAALAPESEPAPLAEQGGADTGGADTGGVDTTQDAEGHKPPTPRDLAPPGISAREVAARITPLRGIPIRLPPEARVTPQRKRATIVLIAIALVVVATLVVLIALRADKLIQQLGAPAPLPPELLVGMLYSSSAPPPDMSLQIEGTTDAPTQLAPPRAPR
jgi:serine/threonine protein phosphatase PrpC